MEKPHVEKEGKVRVKAMEKTRNLKQCGRRRRRRGQRNSQYFSIPNGTT